MAFIDEAKITIIAGSGGNGCVSFRREKYIPRGGPNGGNGGRGGSVYFHATRDKTSLLDFKFRPKYEGKSGQHGMGSDCDGRGGEDLILDVPVGTRIFTDSGDLLADLTQHDEVTEVARGGKGGRGNKTFTTSTNRTPRISTPGEAGEIKSISLELSMLADVGLVGLPNAGKSSFLRVISNARPKVADYPFTTLEPNLGVVNGKGSSFIVADIPGLIEGASDGAGLGHRFLKHVMRNRVLLHIVECTATKRTIEKSISTISQELKAFDPSIVEKNRIFVFTKADLLSKTQLASRKKALKAYNGIFISSHTHQGIDEVLSRISTTLSELT
ncbi:MAG: GTPase ObgE [Deltaproteobacteria bacterium]|nr:GTPase ObgE [Deltaproteobacteria bacterium]MBI3294361.1 GTPase ObgE [Deltaproteobacteria bacterium]